MDKIMECVPLAEDDQEERLREIIQKAIKDALLNLCYGFKLEKLIFVFSTNILSTALNMIYLVFDITDSVWDMI